MGCCGSAPKEQERVYKPDTEPAPKPKVADPMLIHTAGNEPVEDDPEPAPKAVESKPVQDDERMKGEEPAKSEEPKPVEPEPVEPEPVKEEPVEPEPVEAEPEAEPKPDPTIQKWWVESKDVWPEGKIGPFNSIRLAHLAKDGWMVDQDSLVIDIKGDRKWIPFREVPELVALAESEMEPEEEARRWWAESKDDYPEGRVGPFTTKILVDLVYAGYIMDHTSLVIDIKEGREWIPFNQVATLTRMFEELYPDTKLADTEVMINVRSEKSDE